MVNYFCKSLHLDVWQGYQGFPDVFVCWLWLGRLWINLKKKKKKNRRLTFGTSLSIYNARHCSKQLFVSVHVQIYRKYYSHWRADSKIYIYIYTLTTRHLHQRGVFRTLSNIYDGGFLQKQLTAWSSIIDIL